MRHSIDVSSSGAVMLGPDVVCDGFLEITKARVQTHIHDDHMNEFETSKGFQEILVTKATRELLCAEQNADLPYRANIRVLDEGAPYYVGESDVTLLSSGHMLGSVQVQVALPDGARVGYSGDFEWPLDNVIQVDALVVDSTYGSPERIRKYSQGECESRFMELVMNQLRRGPVHILAFRGTLHRALQLLSGNVDCPLVGSPKLCREVDVYRTFGYTIAPITPVESPEGKEVRLKGRYIRFYGTGDKWPVDSSGTSISLSAYFTRPDDPVMEYSERSYRVALSNHADFKGTLEYVRSTGARFVITDNSRGGSGYELALAIKSRLGVQAQTSSDFESREWGGGGFRLPQ